MELATQMQQRHERSRGSRPPAGWKEPWVTTRMDYAAHADDGNGMWYQAKCDTSTKEGQNQLTELSLAERIWVWEPDGQRAAPEPVVDPVTLARAAVEAAAIPAPSVETNPRITTDDGVEGAAVVGVDTWVWAASGTPSHVEVRATAGSTSVSVSADAGGLSLSAPGARTRCTGWGEPWREGTSREGDSDCVVVFTRSAAHVPLTVSATYDITWTSYAARRSKTGVSAHRDDPDQQIDAIVGAYGSGATAEAHLVGIADVRAKDKTAEEISKATELNGSASTAITAFSTVAAGGFSALPSPAGVALSTTVSTVSTLVAPVAADALVGDPQTASSPVSLQLSDSMMAAAAQDAAQAGLINQDSYQVGPTEENPDIQTAADQYSWVVDDGHGGHTIDLSGTSKEDLAGVNTWATQVADPNRVDQIPPDPRLVRLKDAIDDAAARGYVRGSSSTVDHSSGG